VRVTNRGGAGPDVGRAQPRSRRFGPAWRTGTDLGVSLRRWRPVDAHARSPRVAGRRPHVGSPASPSALVWDLSGSLWTTGRAWRTARSACVRRRGAAGRRVVAVDSSTDLARAGPQALRVPCLRANKLIETPQPVGSLPATRARARREVMPEGSCRVRVRGLEGLSWRCARGQRSTQRASRHPSSNIRSYSPLSRREDVGRTSHFCP